MHALAVALVQARRSDTPIAYESLLAVRDFAEAYAVQAEVTEALDQRVAGWKVGFAPDRTPFAAPIFAGDVLQDGGFWRLGAHPLKIEVELAIRLGRDLPRGALSREALIDSLVGVYAGIEFVQARFVDPNAVPFAARIADNFANLGYVDGPNVTDFRHLRLEALRVRAWSGAELRQEGTGTHQEGDPLAPVLAWIETAADRLGGLRAGQFITTGTLIDPFDMAAPARIRGELDGVGMVAVDLVR